MSAATHDIILLTGAGFEDANLKYKGINRHEGEDVVLYDTVISAREHEPTFVDNPEVVRLRN